VTLTNILGVKVITVTLNPVLDKSLWVKGFKAGGTFQVERSENVAGGKGVNVSRALRTMGFDSIATGFMAEVGSAPYLQLMSRDRLVSDFLLTSGTLRMNITVISEGQKSETHLRERGPVLHPSFLPELEKKLKKLFSEGALFVCAGSLPGGLLPDSYARIIQKVVSWGGRAFLDTSGPPLLEGLKAGPFFIKPNAHEVKEAVGFYPETREDLLQSIERFHGMGIENIMITLGSRGLLLSRNGEVVSAAVTVQRPVNSVGSGDASLAGGIAGLLSGLSVEDTARLACAMGGANTMVSGACVFRREDVLRLVEKTQVHPF
jgi:1-phosphofructokinase family hexose kinase